MHSRIHTSIFLKILAEQVNKSEIKNNCGHLGETKLPTKRIIRFLNAITAGIIEVKRKCNYAETFQSAAELIKASTWVH